MDKIKMSISSSLAETHFDIITHMDGFRYHGFSNHGEHRSGCPGPSAKINQVWFNPPPANSPNQHQQR
jgi:hypothetical protein